MNFQKPDPTELKKIIWKHYQSKPVLSNYYLNDIEQLEIYEEADTLLLRRREHDFYRIYFYAREAKDLSLLLNEIQGKCVINIPVRADTCEMEPELNKIGFTLISRHERWCNPATRVINNFTGVYAEEKHCQEMMAMFEANFDARIDHVPEQPELLEMIRQKRVLINTDGDKLQGFFIFTLEKGKCYFNFWFDNGNRGMETLHNVYHLMHVNGIKYSYLWVNSENVRVKKIHKILGSTPDGLSDFTFYKV